MSETVFDSIDELLAGKIISHANGNEKIDTAGAVAPKTADSAPSSESDEEPLSPETPNVHPDAITSDNQAEKKENESSCRSRVSIGILAAAALIGTMLILIGFRRPKRGRRRSRW